LIFGCSGALQYKVMGVLMDFKIGYSLGGFSETDFGFQKSMFSKIKSERDTIPIYSPFSSTGAILRPTCISRLAT